MKNNKSKKILIIPDLHGDFEKAEKIIKIENPYKIIFLGDYFDNMDIELNGLENTIKVAAWLKKSMKNPNRIHLIGNHEVGYIDEKYFCSGFTKEKYNAIKQMGVNLKELKYFYKIGDYLLTHGGFTKSYYEYLKNIDKKNIKPEKILENFKNNPNNIFYKIGLEKRGKRKCPGIIWCDIREFQNIPNTKQIFGHSFNKEPIHEIDKETNSEFICLDTGFKHYAIYENNKIIIKKIRLEKTKLNKKIKKFFGIFIIGFNYYYYKMKNNNKKLFPI